MPFLDDIRRNYPKVADKIERDSFQTRGAGWGTNRLGQQYRRNRQPRWTLTEGHRFYPKHYQTYPVCLQIAAELTLQAYEMVGAPACPPYIAQYLPRVPVKDLGRCPICLLPMEFERFSLAQQSLAHIDTDHLDPTQVQRHIPGNVAFVHHECNITKGDRSVPQFIHWMHDVMMRHGAKVP